VSAVAPTTTRVYASTFDASNRAARGSASPPLPRDDENG